jgi:hypothetical protein
LHSVESRWPHEAQSVKALGRYDRVSGNACLPGCTNSLQRPLSYLGSDPCNSAVSDPYGRRKALFSNQQVKAGFRKSCHRFDSGQTQECHLIGTTRDSILASSRGFLGVEHSRDDLGRGRSQRLIIILHMRQVRDRCVPSRSAWHASPLRLLGQFARAYVKKSAAFEAQEPHQK